MGSDNADHACFSYADNGLAAGRRMTWGFSPYARHGLPVGRWLVARDVPLRKSKDEDLALSGAGRAKENEGNKSRLAKYSTISCIGGYRMKLGDIISYLDMCNIEGVNLQRGMNYRLRGGISVILMSLRPGAPYADRIEDNGRTLIYEGHDIPTRKDGPDPKSVDQLMHNPNGSLTQNGLFFQSAQDYKQGLRPVENVKVYEKIRAGIWAFNGIFTLVDSWIEDTNARKVFKFKLQLTEDQDNIYDIPVDDLDHNRLIPTSVKLQVWKRDGGKCVVCRSRDNLHFDHIIPYSKGGSSLVSENIQLMCARHNLEKRDKIE